MSSDEQMPSVAGETMEPDTSEIRTPASHTEPAETLSSASPSAVSQTETGMSEVTADSVDVKVEVPAAALSEVSDVAMDVVAEHVRGDGDVGDDGAASPAAAAVVEGDAAIAAGEGMTSAVGLSDPEIPVSADDGAQVVNSVSSNKSSSLCANSSQHPEGQSFESDGTKSKPDQTTSSTSVNVCEQSIENTPPETLETTPTTDITMATVNPAPPTSMPAGDTNSSSVGGREVAASGALAMLAGYDSDEGGHDSDVENTAAAPTLTVDRQGLYRDSLAAPWSDDSESDSDSADDSSASSSSTSDSEPAVEIDDKEEDGETDQARKVFGPMTKGELCLLDLPPIEHLRIVLPEEQCTKVGVITSVVECLVVVQSTPGSSALDIDSVLFLERGRRPLGRIYDVMGPVSEAAYCVRFNTPQEIAEFDIKPGADVFYAPGSAEYSHFVFVEALRKMRGSDASWWDSNEPPENCIDFSDDEEERNHKRQNRKRPLQEASGSAESSSEAPPRPRPAGRPERGRGRGRGGGGPPCRPPWMPPPPRNPFYGQRAPGVGPPMRWQQAPPTGPFNRPPPPPPGGFGQPPPPFIGRPLYGPPSSGGSMNQPPPPGVPPSGAPMNQPPPPGVPPNGAPMNQPPPPWGRPSFWGPR